MASAHHATTIWLPQQQAEAHRLWLAIIMAPIVVVVQQVAAPLPMLTINVAGVKIQASIQQRLTQAHRKQRTEAVRQVAVVSFQTGTLATRTTRVGAMAHLAVTHAAAVGFQLGEVTVEVVQRVVHRAEVVVVAVALPVEPAAGINHKLSWWL
jgi:malonyl CoA-acyl carrier protein transacylase